MADQDDARRLFLSGDIISLEQVIELLSREQAGKIIDAELEEKSQGLIYEVEVLDKGGVVWEYRIDARTGKILQRERDD